MKIALVAINSSWSHSSLALYYLRAMLKGLPYQAEIQSFTLKDDPLNVVEYLAQAGAEIACFSVYIWSRAYLETVLDALLKVKPRLKIVLGGPEAGYLYDYIARTTSMDNVACILGPGEAAFRHLAEGGFEDKGLISRPNIHLREIPFVYSEDDFEDLRGKLVYYETGRGCPYHCIYCLSARDERREYRFESSDEASLANLYEELRLLSALEPKTIKFVDRSFNTDKALAHAVWSWLIERDDAPVAHFEIYPELLDEADVMLLSKASKGKIRFEVGIQSTNEDSLRASGRQMNWAHARKMLCELRDKTSVLVHSDLLVGLPGDSYRSVLDSIDQLWDTKPEELQLGILKILPDTPMLERAKRLGYQWQAQPPYRVLQSDAMDFEQICRLDHIAHLINLYWNKAELKPLWEPVLQTKPASEILEQLADYHLEHGIQFHSLAPVRRIKTWQDCFGNSTGL